MARPREFDRGEALAKARDAFWARGYEGTSIADLVTALGLAPARLYAAFGSKEALFREAVALYEAEEGSFAARALAGEGSARHAVARMLADAVDTYTRPGRPLGCLVVSAAASSAAENDAVRRFLADRRQAQTASIIDRLQRAVADGELPIGTDVQTLGDAVATLLNGIAVKARDGHPKARLDAMCDLVMAALFPPLA